jgi:hypothetical protein
MAATGKTETGTAIEIGVTGTGVGSAGVVGGIVTVIMRPVVSGTASAN